MGAQHLGQDLVEDIKTVDQPNLDNMGMFYQEHIKPRSGERARI